MNLETIFSNLGIFSLTSGQLVMLVVGLLILYLAINKKFEPLLLLPIGFGAILTNVPEIGVALSPIEKLIYNSDSQELVIIAPAFVAERKHIDEIVDKFRKTLDQL